MSDKSTISTQTLQAVVDYLQTRPYSEVSKLISDVVNGVEEYKEPQVKEKQNAGK